MRVVQMRSEGATLQQMVEALGVSASTISADITELGLARSNNNQRGVAA
jgi:DNA-binding CsgD family transcriptional regulator